MRTGQNTWRARELRRHMTPAEHCMWRRLRLRQLLGFRFRRQYPIGPYIVDFACVEQRLVVELDGSQHFDSPTDARRDARIRAMGFRVMRFWNHDVHGNPEGVLASIAAALACPHPSPPP